MAAAGPVRYRSDDEDSGRWEGFPFRHGDIVISTRSKSGTTWMQMICALLIFGSPELPAPLGVLSPWLDFTGVPRRQIYGRLEAQEHRRVIKTHTPLDGIPLDRRATYIVVARHPLDMAVSLYHQGENIDRVRWRALTGQPEPTGPPGPSATAPPPRPALRDWLLDWIDADADPRAQMDSLLGVMAHVSDAWGRRDDENVVLVHYDDLSADLEGTMRALAAVLGVEVAEQRWPVLATAAGFEAMRSDAARLAPDPANILIDRARFFRRGSSGAGGEVLSAEELAHYHRRARSLAAPDVLAWLHHDGGSPSQPPPSLGTPKRSE